MRATEVIVLTVNLSRFLLIGKSDCSKFNQACSMN